jgi:phosphoribosylformylglycinamidine synthase II
MLFVAKKGREQELIDIFHRWELQAVVAGEVIKEPIVRILFKGEIAAEIPANALADNTPIYHRELLERPPEYAQKAWQWTEESLPNCTEEGMEIKGELKTWNDVLLTLLDTPSIASKKWVYRQYDHQVQNNTVILPGGADAAVIRIRPIDAKPDTCKIGVAATTDCNSRYVYLDPLEGAKAAVAEAARNLSCVGAEPLAITDNLNFGSPENTIGYWQLALACQGISQACQELNTPVTGGNVSLYNETVDSDGKPQPIYPTPVIGMVGLIPDITKICGQGWQKEGDIIYLLGVDNKPTLGASEYLASLHDIVSGKPPKVDFNNERLVQKACRDGIRNSWINSAHDCAEGGLIVALAECCISGNLGAETGLDFDNEMRLDTFLFGEVCGQIIVSVSPDNEEIWETYLGQKLVNNWQKIGQVTSNKLSIVLSNNSSVINVEVEHIIDVWSNAIERRIT